MHDLIALHYGTVAFAMGLSALGVGLGEGIVTNAAVKAINIQPSARTDIMRIAMIGGAVIETAAIMSSIIALLILRDTQYVSYYANLSKVGIGLAICLPGFVVGLLSALPAQAACLAIARQPFFGAKILRMMLITQSLIQTPVVFGFIIAIIIKNNIPYVTTLADSIQLIASGLSIGLGSIGPTLGLAYFAHTVCWALGINREAYPKLLTFTFISEAIIETPIIFSMIISIIILYTPLSVDNALLNSIAMLAGALCMGLGTLGSGMSTGATGAATCKQIAYNPPLASTLSRISLASQTLIDSCSIYAFVVAMAMIRFLR